MRILFLTQFFDPEPGAIRGLPLARWLLNRGHDIEVVTGFPNYPGGKVYPEYRIRTWQREVMDGINVLRLPIYPSHDRNPIHRAANYVSFALSASTIGLLLSTRPDVLYVYHPPATVGLSGMVFRALHGIPVVYHIADMWPDSVVQSGMIRDGWQKRLVESLLTKACSAIYARADCITVLSDGFRQLLVDRGVPERKIHVVYNWAPEDTFSPIAPDPELAERLGMKGRFNVVYAGNLGVFQGLDTVIRAAARLRRFPEIQFVLAGMGQDEKHLRALSRELETRNVLFLGHRPYREMNNINAIADVLLVHLRDLPFFAFTIPSKTQVALASGRPVLMAVRGDAAALVERSGGGLVCDPENGSALAEAVLQMYRMSPQERRLMGEKGREYYVREMSLDRGGQTMEQLFLSVSGSNYEKAGSRVPEGIAE